MMGTGWSMLTSLSVIDQKKPSTQHINTDSITSLQKDNGFNSQPFSHHQISKAMVEISQQSSSPLVHQKVQVIGDTRLFWVENFITDEREQITATLKVNGSHSLIYSNLTTATIPDSTFLDINHTFETVIYPTLTKFFGYPSDIDNNRKIIILVYDIIDGLVGGYIAGYFDANDIYTKVEWEQSNEAEIINIDVLAAKLHVYDIVAHEFQHLIHYSHDEDEHLWLDEGASMFAEYLVGEDPFISSVHKSEFIANPDVSLTYWDYYDDEGLVFANYGAAYAFFLYLAEHYGGSSIIQNVVLRSTDGIESIEEALANIGSPVKFVDVFRNWTVANFLDDTSFANGMFGYYNASISMVVENSYSTSSVPRTENSVPYWGTDYLQFTDRTNFPFVLEFQGKTADFIATAILTNKTTPFNTEVIPIEISEDGLGNFSTESYGISADQIVIAVSSITEPGPNDHNDTIPAPAQPYWFMVNPKGITISPGNLTLLISEARLQIWNVTVSDVEEFKWQEADGATYDILTETGNSTGISGNLTYNLEKDYWETSEINISSLHGINNTYRVKYHFYNSTSSGIAFSNPFNITLNSSTQSSNTAISSTIAVTTPFIGLFLVITVLTISPIVVNRRKK